jgi:uncharacterized protein YwgA
MDAETLVLSLLETSPDKEIRGKKRLQKLAYFATNLGARAAVQFSLHDFGPFSPDVASAAQMLSLFGEVTENQIQVGNTKRFVTVYKISDHTTVPESLPLEVAAKLAQLVPYSTVELEIASTILYFYNLNHDWAVSIAATQSLKPTKSVPQVIRRATEALSGVQLYEGRRTDPMPGP